MNYLVRDAGDQAGVLRETFHLARYLGQELARITRGEATVTTDVGQNRANGGKGEPFP